ncbi:MAG: hypothetical protein H6822_17415 [Planctomycetaceae bacterium]|nr:hypothetical protein [Planctomycetales bacterium]MCB9923965.1 hypothetical protein [Planctomycetaceae bacterium]
MSNTLFSKLAALLILFGATAPQVTKADDLWEVGAGAIFLNRDASYSGAVVVDNSHNPLMASSALNTGYHGGINVDVTRNCTETYSLNARFFAIDDWTVNTTATTTNGAWLYGHASPGSTLITGIDSIFGSDLYSAELNLVHRHNEWLDLMAGFRWLSINENLNIEFTEGMNPYAEYEGFANNDLYGFQGGAAVNFIDHGGPFTLDGVFKAGIYGNDVGYDGQYVNGTMTQVRNSSTRVAFAGEIGIMASLLLTDCISVSAGYQLLWVDGLALLGEQFAAIDWATQSGGSTSGNAFYHGAVVNVTVLLP